MIEDRERWKAAVPHEGRPGQTAVSEADRDLLVRNPVRSVSCWPARGHPGTSTSFPVLMKIVRIKAGDDIAYGVADVEGVLVYIGSPFVAWEPTETVVPWDAAHLLAPVLPTKVVAGGATTKITLRSTTRLSPRSHSSSSSRRRRLSDPTQCRSPRPSRRTSTMRQSSRQ